MVQKFRNRRGTEQSWRLFWELELGMWETVLFTGMDLGLSTRFHMGVNNCGHPDVHSGMQKCTRLWSQRPPSQAQRITSESRQGERSSSCCAAEHAHGDRCECKLECLHNMNVLRLLNWQQHGPIKSVHCAGLKQTKPLRAACEGYKPRPRTRLAQQMLLASRLRHSNHLGLAPFCYCV